MRKITKYFLPVVLTFFIVLLLLFRFGFNSKVDVQDLQYEKYDKQIIGEKDPVKQKALLEEIHREIGPAKTLKLLISTFGYSNSLEGHGWVHIFGSLLYQKHRVEGMVYCDLVFDFGCYHGFFGEAIPREGIEVINKADELCIKKFGKDGFGCQHGIGHGVLEYFGPERINEALEACSTLKFQGKIFGCQDGVFMDYNFPLVDDAEALLVSARQYNDKRPYEPCDIVSERYKESCYYTLSQWALAVFDNDYARAVNLCHGIGSIDFRDACLLGIGGAVFVDKNYDEEEAVKICLTFDSESRALCVTAAAWVAYASLPHDQRGQAVEKLCGQLQDSDNAYCMRNYNLYKIYGIDNKRVEYLTQ